MYYKKINEDCIPPFRISPASLQVLIASHLKNLEDEDASRIIHVRRVHKVRIF